MPVKPSQAHSERRSLPRYAGGEISAYVRLKGSFSRLSAGVLDFNRHGAAIHVHQPLPAGQLVYLTLKHGVTQLERIIGIVHNCVNFDAGFRCGIRFRTQSDQQFDRVLIEGQLANLEARLSNRRPAADAG